MSVGPTTSGGERPRKRRWWLVITVVLVVAVAGVLAAIFIPVHSSSQVIQVTSTSGSSATLSLPASSWVTLHFDHPGTMAMRYWMNGPGGGMMFNHQGMMNGDTYSFWSGGGNFQCWAGYAISGSGVTPVWVNATWGMI